MLVVEVVAQPGFSAELDGTVNAGIDLVLLTKNKEKFIKDEQFRSLKAAILNRRDHIWGFNIQSSLIRETILLRKH